MVLPGESEWLDTDREKVVAVQLDRAARCSSCGIHQDDNREGEPVVVPETYRCFTCQRAERLRKSIPSGADEGVTIQLRPRTPDDLGVPRTEDWNHPKEAVPHDLDGGFAGPPSDTAPLDLGFQMVN